MESNLRSLGIENKDRQGCEVWTRVMGYYRPRFLADGDSRYNLGKQSEYDERNWYTND